MIFELPEIVIVFGTLNSLILLVSLVSLPPTYKKPALFLGLIILGYTLNLFNWIGMPSIGDHLDMPTLWIPTLYYLPALIYFFSISLQKDFDFDIKKLWYYLIPGLLDTVHQLYLWIRDLIMQKSYVFPMNRSLHYFIHEAAAFLFAVFCLYKIVTHFRLNRARSGLIYKSYKFAFYFVIFVMIRWSVTITFDLFFPSLLNTNIYLFLWGVEVAILLYIGFRSIVMPNKFALRLVAQANAEEATLSPESARLMEVINDQRLYLKPDLNRNDLAGILGISDVKVSGLFNEELNTTFYGYINKLRIEESKRLIASGLTEKYTLETIARQAGFQSKSTFNKSFRSYTNMTPTQYRASCEK